MENNILFNSDCNNYLLFLATYELALKAEKNAVASSESENERQSGKRKIKHNKYKDYVDFIGPPKLVSSYNKCDDTSTSSTGKLLFTCKCTTNNTILLTFKKIILLNYLMF